MRWETPPFERGRTWYGGEIIATPPVGEFLGGFNYEGAEFEFQDPQLPISYGTGMATRVRCVRNSTGGPVLPGQLVTLLATTRVLDNQPVLPGTNADSIARTTAAHAFPADEFLPAAGVPNGDLFYVIVSGPCLVKTAQSGTVTLTVDQKVVCGTMAGTTSPDAGCVVAQDLTGATAVLGGQIQNAIGRAMSAISAGGTGQPVLIDVGW